MINNNLPGIGLSLSGGGVRATVFHLGALLRLAKSQAMEKIEYLSTVSGGSLAVGLILCNSAKKWPTSGNFINKTLPQVENLLTTKSLQGKLLMKTLCFPWRLLMSRAKQLAALLESTWNINGNVIDLPEKPLWFINTTCFETGKNWRFSQRHMGDWVFGHHYKPNISIARAIAASAAVPYVIGMLKFQLPKEGWFEINPANDEPIKEKKPPVRKVRLWDGGAYENLGMEAIYKQGRGVLHKNVEFVLISDASARLKTYSGRATGPFDFKKKMIKGGFRLVDITTDQIRSLRSRILINDLKANAFNGSLLRLGNTVSFITESAKREGANFEDFTSGIDVLNEQDVKRAAQFETTLRKLSKGEFALLLRHGFETANATLCAYKPDYFTSTNF